MAVFTQPRITERRYLQVIPLLLTQDSTNKGLITIESTFCFKVGQTLVFTLGATIQQAKIQAVISETQFIVIDIGESITTRKTIDMTVFVTGSTVELYESKRPVISIDEIQRIVYEEEPTVALRNHLVDWLGRSYGIDNPQFVASNVKDKYVVHELDEDGTITYIGKITTTGTWFIDKLVEVDPDLSLTYANLSNNLTFSTFDLAWAARTSLAYTSIDNLTGV